jgi:hypothetical protein
MEEHIRLIMFLNLTFESLLYKGEKILKIYS